MLDIHHLSFGPEPSLVLGFADGRTGRVAVADLLKAGLPPVFEALRESDFFRSAILSDGVVSWPGELDLAPEFLYFLSFRDDPGLRERFAAWGYTNASVN